MLISTQGSAGADTSPRGDPPGFVKPLDQHTLLIPDRPGNNRLDTFENILENPHVGCLFLVPGLAEILRINGTARLVVGEELEALAVQNRAPKMGICVSVEQAFFHCAKAVMRSRIWQPDTFRTRSDFPPLGVILSDQVAGLDREKTIEFIRTGDQTTMY